MTALSVDRFTLEAGERSSEDAERLGMLVAERLRTSLPYVDELTNVDVMNVRVADEAGRDVDWLAERIVEAIVRELARIA